MMNSYQRQTELTTEALNSQGAAEEANAIHMESMAAKSAQLKATLSGIWDELISSDALKGLTELITLFLQLISYGDGIVIKVGLVVGGFVLLKTTLQSLRDVTFFTKLRDNISALMNPIMSLIAQAGSLKEAMASIGSSIGALAGAHPVITAIVAVAGATWGISKIVDALTVSLEEQAEKVEKVKEEYSSLKTELDSIDSELKANKTRIDEINNGKIEYLNPGELDKLKEANVLLETQKALLQEDLNNKALEVERETLKKYEIENKNGSHTREYKNAVIGRMPLKDLPQTEAEAVDYYIKKYEQLGLAIQEVSGKSEQQKDKEQKQFEAAKKELIELGNTYGEYSNEFKNAQTDAGKAAYEEASKYSDQILRALNPDEYNKIKFESVFDDESFKKSKEELLELAKNGRLSEDVINSYKELNDVLDKTGLSAQDLVNYINQLAQSNTNGAPLFSNLNQAAQQLQGTDAGNYISQFTERMGVMNSRLQEGKIAAYEYFNALNTELSNVDFTKYTDNMQEASAMQAAFFVDATTQVAQGMSDIQNSFAQGKISASEYLDGLTSIGDSMNILTDMLQSNADSWVENGEDVDSARSRLDSVQSDLQNGIAVVNSYKDSIYSLSQLLQGSFDVGSDEFTAHANVIAQDLSFIAQSGGAMADEIKSRLGSTSAEIAQSLANDTSNMGFAAQAIANNANIGIQNIGNSVAVLFTELGNAIANFKVQLSFKVTDVKWNPLSIFNKEFQLPQVNFELSADGSTASSFKSIGNAVSSFGKSLAGSIQKIDLSSYFNKASQGYKPSANTIGNYNKALDGVKNKNNAAKKATDDQRDALKKQKEAFEDAEKSINDLIDLTVKMLKKRAELNKEALKDELDGLKKRIDYEKELLEAKKDEYDYERGLEDRNRSISEIEKRLNAIRLDDSATAQKERAELEAELAEQNRDLADYQHDHKIDQDKDALDKEYEKFEETQNEKIKALESYLDQEGTIRQEAIALIESRSYELYENLMDWNLKYGDGTKQTIVDAWNTAYSALDKYGLKQLGVLGVLRSLQQNIINAQNQMNNLASSTANAGNMAYGAAGGAAAMANNIGAGATNAATLANNLHVARQQMAYLSGGLAGLANSFKGTMFGNIFDYMSKVTSAFNGKGIGGVLGGAAKIGGVFHNGIEEGFVGGSAQLKSNEIFIKALKGEVIATPHQIDKFMKEIMPAIAYSSGQMFNATNPNNLGAGVNFGSLIEINAESITNDSLPEMRRIANSAVDKGMDKLVAMFKIMGVPVNLKSRTI